MHVTQSILFCIYLIRYVHGETVRIANFSYNAEIYFHCVRKDLSDDYFVCGASIVNQLLVLTAGHCLFECTENSVVYVFVGQDEGKKFGDEYKSHSFLHHDDYDPVSYINDIGLVRLVTPLEFNSNIGRVALMPDPPYSEEALVAGWGMYDEDTEEFSAKLQYTNQSVLIKEDCQKLLDKNVIKGTFCASGNADYVYRGETGSPLVVRGYIQIGLVSFKMIYKSGETHNGGLYTDIGYFYKWIDDNAHFIACEI